MEDTTYYSQNALRRIEKNTRRRNAEFEKMPNHRKRVLIAKDVLKALATKKLVAKGGSYIRVKDVNLQWLMEEGQINPEGSFQETFANIPQCTVCAKGAIFACTIARRNQVKNNQVPSNWVGNWTGVDLAPLLGGIFSPEQLRLMEVEFEGEDFEARKENGIRNFPVMRDMPFEDEDRMIRIMRNIIRNNGDFIPSKD